MTLSVTDVFPTVENRYKAPVKILASLYRGGAWFLRSHSGCATVPRYAGGEMRPVLAGLQ